jgi:hypothetical protein
MPEVPDRLCDDETARHPAANSYALYYTATAVAYFGMGICNGEGADAHISVFLIPASQSWILGSLPQPYTVIAKNIRIEADGVDGNVWELPVAILRSGDRIVVFTDLVGVTFNGHGIKQVGDVSS